MKNLLTLLLLAALTFGLAANGLAENMVTVDINTLTICSSPSQQMGSISFTFAEGTRLRGEPGEYGLELFYIILEPAALSRDIDYQISGANSTPILTNGLSPGTYGPITFLGEPLTATGSGVYFRVLGFQEDRLLRFFVLSEDGSEVIVPPGGLTITLFDSSTYPSYLWERGAGDEYSDSLEPEDNTLLVDASWARDEGIFLHFESYWGLFFEGDKLLANLLIARANAGPDQIVFDRVTLDGSESQGSGETIVDYQWQLLHRSNPDFNRTAEGMRPTLQNLEPGFYNVILTITDDGGCTGQAWSLLAAAGRCGGGSTAAYMLLLDD